LHMYFLLLMRPTSFAHLILLLWFWKRKVSQTQIITKPILITQICADAYIFKKWFCLIWCYWSDFSYFHTINRYLTKWHNQERYLMLFISYCAVKFLTRHNRLTYTLCWK
jgi:hypothetical protein